MLTPSRRAKFIAALKAYRKRYLSSDLTELDESGTRLMINAFLSEVLGFQPIEEIKTEYMIKGTYADYVLQSKGIRHFLVEVKAYSLQLSEKHLRQTINYGANEGIEWAMLTNGKQFDFYKILFNKPIESRKIFSVDLSDATDFLSQVDFIQYLHKDAILKRSLKLLWNRCEALHPLNIAGMLYSKDTLRHLHKLIKSKYGEKCDDAEIVKTLNIILLEKIDPLLIKQFRSVKAEKRTQKVKIEADKLLVAKDNLEQIDSQIPAALN